MINQERYFCGCFAFFRFIIRFWNISVIAFDTFRFVRIRTSYISAKYIYYVAHMKSDDRDKYFYYFPKYIFSEMFMKFKELV